MISAEEARKIVVSNTPVFRSRTIPLREAHERILASDVRSKDDIPPFKNSSMDGFAVRSSDAAGADGNERIELPIQSEIAAGASSTQALRPNMAIRILTGAPLPEGADAVIPVEQVEEQNGSILFSI
ncbi:MAG TPA: molybdopterin molybdenumtransferase MoeA, partial [Bacteroidota bacterium]